jgi:hypothetical protein
MDRSKYQVSVVPRPTDQTSSARVQQIDENAAWDSKWLRPNVAVIEKPAYEMTTPEPSHEEEEEKEEESVPMFLRALRWLFPEVNQRRAVRFPTPGLVAYYWTGGASRSYHVGDMSATGLFLLTKERWAPGTLIQMTLQRQDTRASGPEDSICVLTEVVRWSENGAGFNFVLSDYENVLDYGLLPGEAMNRKSVERFLHKVGAPGSR